jgi:hypothetical protein
MKKQLLILVFCLLGAGVGYSQVSVSVLNNEEAEVDVRIKRFKLGCAFNPDEKDLAKFLPTVKMDVVTKEDYNISLGCTLESLEEVKSFRIPLRLNYYPFQKKRLGIILQIDNRFADETSYEDDFSIRGLYGFVFRL